MLRNSTQLLLTHSPTHTHTLTLHTHTARTYTLHTHTHCTHTHCTHTRTHTRTHTHTQVYCGRYINQHMLHHEETSGHKVVLSLADFSVWCFACDSYINNEVYISSKVNPSPLHKHYRIKVPSLSGSEEGLTSTVCACTCVAKVW